ncbi:MAG: hypothetical protein RL497_1881 [Pseudomonadota bacterium]
MLYMFITCIVTYFVDGFGTSYARRMVARFEELFYTA